MRILLFVVLFIYSFLICSQENSLLWEIKGKGLEKPSYLYGTYHTYDSRAHEFGDSVLVKLAKSEIVAVEVVDYDPIKYVNIGFMNGKKLEDLLSSEDFTFVKQNVEEKIGKSGAYFNTMKPFLTMTLAGIQNGRKEELYTVDEFIRKQAKEQAKNLVGLETTEEANKAIDAISLKEQAKTLVDFFKNYDKSIVVKDSFIKLYEAQDLKGMFVYYTSQKDITASFEREIVEKRNNKFLDKLIPLIKKQSVFCAVGTLHLVGETGLINGLRKKGYQVTPVYSKYTPKQTYIVDKGEWELYESDTMLIQMRFPKAPYLRTIEPSTSALKTAALNYYLTDSINNMNYMVTATSISDTNYFRTVTYKSMIENWQKKNGWKMISNKEITFQDIPAIEVEFNISSGINVRYQAVLNGTNLYLIGVIGSKKNIYSNLADKFFKNISLLYPSLSITLNISDEVSNKGLNTFDVSIKSSAIDTVLKPDTAGYIAFTLPAGKEEYILKVISKNYVTKIIQLNTEGAYKTGQTEVSISGDVSMIKKKPRVDYSVFNKPIAKAHMIGDNTFGWDMEYISKMKEEINNKIGRPTIILK